MTREYIKTQLSTLFFADVLYGITHSLGAPIRHATQFSELLSDLGSSNTLDDKHRRWLSLINQSSVSAQNMLQSLAEMSAITQQTEDTSQLDLALLFNEQLGYVKNQLLGEYTHIEINQSFTPLNILAVKSHWQTVFLHLIKNAILFQPKAPSRPIHLVAKLTLENKQLCFSLEDNGIGVSPNQYKAIIRPFKRCNKVEEYPGNGMGLSYCYLIAELNGGSIGFSQSELGGLKVSLTHPVTNAHLTVEKEC